MMKRKDIRAMQQAEREDQLRFIQDDWEEDQPRYQGRDKRAMRAAREEKWMDTRDA